MVGVGSGVICLGWIYEAYFCFSDSSECLLDQFRLSFFEPLFLLSLSLTIISPFLFFISDKIFLRWLRFSLIWFGLAIIFIGVSPQYSGGWMSLGPTKESISIMMSALFVMLSLGIVGYNKYGERK